MLAFPGTLIDPKWIHTVSKFIALIPLRSICQMLANFFLELNSKGLYLIKKKELELCALPPENVKTPN